MKKNKKIFIFVLTMIFVSCMGISITFVKAYMTDNKNVVNELQIGNVDVKIKEEFPDPGEITGGDSFEKKVSAENTGKCDCYVRGKIVLSNSQLGKYLSMDYDETNWEQGEDGYWYFKSVVPVGGSTTELIKVVTVDSDTPEEAIRDLDIYVYCEAWQSQGFSSYKEAWEYAAHNK